MSKSKHADPLEPRPLDLSKAVRGKYYDPLAPRPNLDFSKGVRGKYYDSMREGTNVVLIAPDLLDTFPDSESVNEALRGLKKIATRSARATSRSRKTASAT